jgi:hypothetical protein
MLCGCTNAENVKQSNLEDLEERKVVLFSKYIQQSEDAAKFVQLFPESYYYVKVEDEELNLFEISMTSFFGGRFKIAIIQPEVNFSSSKLEILNKPQVRLEEIVEVTPLSSGRFKLTHGRNWDLNSSQWGEINTLKSLMKLVEIETIKPTEGFELYQNHMLDIYSEFGVTPDN